MNENQPFDLVTHYQPAGDQPQAIEKLVNGIEKGFRNQLLLGVTGSGKTPYHGKCDCPNSASDDCDGA